MNPEAITRAEQQLMNSSLHALETYFIDALGYTREELWDMTYGLKARELKRDLVSRLSDEQIIEAAAYMRQPINA